MKKKAGLFNFITNEFKIPNIILGSARKNNQIIYGRRAMNAQLPGFLRATTYDFDIYANKPRRTAHRMQKRLDEEIGGGSDIFYSKPAQHKGTHRVMHIGFDARKGTQDDFAIADYTAKKQAYDRKIKIIKRGGIMYEGVSTIARRKKQILRDPKSEYRHEKDQGDLRRIEVARILQTRPRPIRW